MSSPRALPLLMLVSLLASRGALAQSVEAEWRVVSNVSATTVPRYDNGANPFPVRADAPQEPQKDETAEDSATRKKAEALARARDLINSNKVFRPNVQGLVFDGYISGKGGEKVFHNGQWIGVGSGIQVPVKGADSAYQTIEQLKAIDKGTADEVAKELNDRLSSSPLVTLRISQISAKEVILTDKQSTYRVPVRQGGF